MEEVFRLGGSVAGAWLNLPRQDGGNNKFIHTYILVITGSPPHASRFKCEELLRQ